VTPAKIRQFWDWFSARADKVRVDPGNHVPEIGEMVDRLRDGLAWEMGQASDGVFEFILRSGASESTVPSRGRRPQPPLLSRAGAF
jgi:hypothetical protein